MYRKMIYFSFIGQTRFGDSIDPFEFWPIRYDPHASCSIIVFLRLR